MFGVQNQQTQNKLHVVWYIGLQFDKQAVGDIFFAKWM